MHTHTHTLQLPLKEKNESKAMTTDICLAQCRAAIGMTSTRYVSKCIRMYVCTYIYTYKCMRSQGTSAYILLDVVSKRVAAPAPRSPDLVHNYCSCFIGDVVNKRGATHNSAFHLPRTRFRIPDEKERKGRSQQKKYSYRTFAGLFGTQHVLGGVCVYRSVQRPSMVISYMFVVSVSIIICIHTYYCS
jgi:hypothetical protein